jgi:hypothetical protein
MSHMLGSLALEIASNSIRNPFLLREIDYLSDLSAIRVLRDICFATRELPLLVRSTYSMTNFLVAENNQLQLDLLRQFCPILDCTVADSRIMFNYILMSGNPLLLPSLGIDISLDVYSYTIHRTLPQDPLSRAEMLNFVFQPDVFRINRLRF